MRNMLDHNFSLNTAASYYYWWSLRVGAGKVW